MFPHPLWLVSSSVSSIGSVTVVCTVSFTIMCVCADETNVSDFVVTHGTLTPIEKRLSTPTSRPIVEARYCLSLSYVVSLPSPIDRDRCQSFESRMRIAPTGAAVASSP